MKHSIIILASFLFLCISCKNQEPDLFISIKALDEITNEPLQYCRVEVVEFIKPILTKQGEKKIIVANTNVLGEFSFLANKSKSYYIYIYSPEFISKDYIDPILGGVSLESRNFNSNQVIEIPCKKPSKERVLKKIL